MGFPSSRTRIKGSLQKLRFHRFMIGWFWFVYVTKFTRANDPNDFFIFQGTFLSFWTCWRSDIDAKSAFVMPFRASRSPTPLVLPCHFEILNADRIRRSEWSHGNNNNTVYYKFGSTEYWYRGYDVRTLIVERCQQTR